MRVQERCPWNLTDKELNECRNLTYTHGMMKSQLSKALYDRVGRTFFVKDGDRIVGWALVTPMNRTGSQQDAMFFIHPDHRRQGYGSQMLRIIRRRYTYVHTYASTSENTPFFSPQNRKAYPLGPHHGNKRKR